MKAAFAEARGQVRDYRSALAKQRRVGPPPGGRGGDTVRPRGYAVVAVGLERLLGEEVAFRGELS